MPSTPSFDYDWGNGIAESMDSLTGCHMYNTLSQSDMTIMVSSTIDTWTDGACMMTGSANIHVGYQPVANFAFVDNLGTNVSFASLAMHADSIEWHLGNGVTTNDSAFVYQFNSHDTAWVTLYAWNDCGVDSSVQYILPDPASVRDIDISSLVSVYPNPANDVVQIDINADGEFVIELYDLTGRLVSTDYAIQRSRLSTVTLSPGAYSIRITQGNQVANKRLIIQR